MKSRPPYVVLLPPEGALGVYGDAEALALAGSWLPLAAARQESGRPLGVGAGSPSGAGGAPGAAIEISQGEAGPSAEEAPGGKSGGEPSVRVGGVGLWVGGERAVLHGEACAGEIDLEGARARLGVLAPKDARARLELFWMLSLAAGLLWARLGCALVHAGAAVRGTGGAALFVGSGGSGKTTACANLLRAGWGCLADDHVVLARGEGGGIRAYGLPRAFGIDAGWPAGPPRGKKRRVDPRALGPGGLIESAPLGAVFRTSVRERGPTRSLNASSGRVLAALLRQSPWLTLDRAAAEPMLDLLSAACRGSTFALELGSDAFADAEPLERALEGPWSS